MKLSGNTQTVLVGVGFLILIALGGVAGVYIVRGIITLLQWIF